MKKALQFGPLFVIIAALLWSLDGILRISLYSLPPAVVVFYEHVLGFLALLFIFPVWIRDLTRMSWREWVAIIIVALFSGALGTIFYTAALQRINYTQYSVVVLLQQQLQPVWAILAAAVLLKERITRTFLFWAAVALIAAYFVTFKDLRVDITTGAGTAIAGLLAVGAGFMWGSSTAISKFVLKRVGFLTGTVLRFFFAPIFALLYIFGQHQAGSLSGLTGTQWLTLFVITFSTGMVAVGFYYYGLKRTPARVTTLCELVWPASAVCIDYFLYHKTLSYTQMFGIMLLFVAIYSVTKPTNALAVGSAERSSRQ